MGNERLLFVWENILVESLGEELLSHAEEMAFSDEEM